jgi:hypothetical protein
VFLDEEMRWSRSDLRGVHVSVSLTDLSGDDGEQGRDNDLVGECIAAALLLPHPTASRHESRRRMALSLPGLHFRNRLAAERSSEQQRRTAQGSGERRGGGFYLNFAIMASA